MDLYPTIVCVLTWDTRGISNHFTVLYYIGTGLFELSSLRPLLLFVKCLHFSKVTFNVQNALNVVFPRWTLRKLYETLCVHPKHIRFH